MVEYNGYTIYVDEKKNRWKAYLKVDGVRQFVVSRWSLESLQEVLDKNPKPQDTRDSYVRKSPPGVGELESINECRKHYGLSEIKIVEKTCMSCKKVFKSYGNYICSYCKSNGFKSTVLSGFEID